MSQTILRAPRRYQWLSVDKRTVEDVRLSWAARGLLIYLLSRPDDWRVLIRDLVKRGNLKRDGIYKLMKELRSVGYLRYVETRDAQGRLRGGTYIVSELPCPDLPETESPDTAGPGPANTEALLTKEVDLVNNNNHSLLTPTHGAAGVLESIAARLPDSLPLETRSAAISMLTVLAPHEAQWVVDEWIGALTADRIKSSALRFLAALVRRCQDGALEPRYSRKSQSE